MKSDVCPIDDDRLQEIRCIHAVCPPIVTAAKDAARDYTHAHLHREQLLQLVHWQRQQIETMKAEKDLVIAAERKLIGDRGALEKQLEALQKRCDDWHAESVKNAAAVGDLRRQLAGVTAERVTAIKDIDRLSNDRDLTAGRLARTRDALRAIIRSLTTYGPGCSRIVDEAVIIETARRALDDTKPNPDGIDYESIVRREHGLGDAS